MRRLVVLVPVLLLAACASTGTASRPAAVGPAVPAVTAITNPYSVGEPAAYDACLDLANLARAAQAQTLAAADLPSKLAQLVSDAKAAAGFNPLYADLSLRAQQIRAAGLDDDGAGFAAAEVPFASDCAPVLAASKQAP